MAQRYGNVVGQKYPIQTTVLVPCTKNADKPITKQACRKRANVMSSEMTRMFGGYTSSNVTGGYYSKKKKKIIREPVIRVTSYSTKKDYKRNKGKFLRYVAKKGKTWGQEEMGVIIENDLIYLGRVKK